jgi:predicted nucleic-acid-binding Zn-ribbon protein
MESTKQCARCGGADLVEARLEQPLFFHVNDDTHHSICKVAMKATLCQGCGYTEFWMIDPARALPCDEEEPLVQEEDF